MVKRDTPKDRACSQKVHNKCALNERRKTQQGDRDTDNQREARWSTRTQMDPCGHRFQAAEDIQTDALTGGWS